MKRLFLSLLLVLSLPLMASHIVGGEFELLHLTGNQYQLNMILYFDLKNGSKGALDRTVTVSIYRKSDNRFMTNVILPLVDSTVVGYTQPACSNGDLSTAKLVYTSTLSLLPGVYNDPGGYYMSWQRCCRNYSITNIYSEDPNVGGIAAGQTFYLEFPAVVRNGQPFYNSSPHLFPPLNDYACPGRPYYVNFAGVDDDFDSLVYSLVTPLSTNTSDALPPPSPAPYPNVIWQPGYSLTDILQGHPDLRISLDGFITCTPSEQGLFVFAVKVEQYRDKIKIGESRRDFQMLVVDGCQPDAPPQILGKKLTDATYTYNNTMSISFDNTVTDGNRCIQVQVSDPDSQNPLYNNMQTVTIKAIPLNFKDSILNIILPAVTSQVLKNGSVADFSICFPECPLVKNGPAQIGIVAYDNACSLPLTDTLRVTIAVQPPPNSPPYFVQPPPPSIVTQTINEGDSVTWTFQIKDPDNDTLVVSLLTDGFVLADAGMTFRILSQQPGLVTGQIHWDAYCNIYNFTKRTTFQVTVQADDKDKCNSDDPVKAVYNLTVKLPGVADPVITVDLAGFTGGVVRHVGESLSFNVTGTQADGDFIKLLADPVGFKLADYQMTFPAASGAGLATSHFQWDIRCNNVNLAKRDTFVFYFVVFDSANKCRIQKTDTVAGAVGVYAAANTKPVLTIESLNDVPVVNNSVSITLGQTIFLNLTGADSDVPKDSLSLKLIGAEGNVEPKGYTFANSKALGSVLSPFLWDPDCAIFQDKVFTNTYTFKFSVVDNVCFNVKGDTLTLDVKIKDVDAGSGEFRPPNVITPNGDGCNDYFALDGLDNDPECGRDPAEDEKIALPLDNCTGKFQFIRIFNRWGKMVYESSDRKFRWYAQSQDAGVYYYYIGFTNRDYKGALSIEP
jgi:hypothetical protein